MAFKMKGFPQQSGISPIKQNETASDIAGEAAGLSAAELGRAAEGMARGEEKSEIEPYESIEILNNPELNELKSNIMESDNIYLTLNTMLKDGAITEEQFKNLARDNDVMIGARQQNDAAIVAKGGKLPTSY
jgi:hypothetical protein